MEATVADPDLIANGNDPSRLDETIPTLLWNSIQIETMHLCAQKISHQQARSPRSQRDSPGTPWWFRTRQHTNQSPITIDLSQRTAVIDDRQVPPTQFHHCSRSGERIR